LRPVLFEFFGETIYSYPLMMGIAWGVAYHLGRYYLARGKAIEQGYLGLYLGVFASAWLGAKGLFLLASSGDKLTLYASSSSFWLGGGFVFYGGLLGGLLFIFIYSFVLKKFAASSLGFLAPVLVFSHAIGRFGCVLAGCCFGDQCEIPWMVQRLGMTRYPVQAFEIGGLLIIGAFLHYQITKARPSQFLGGIYLAGYGVLRFFLEFLRGDAVRGFTAGLSTSQWISLVLIVVGAVLLLKSPKLLSQDRDQISD
jgi:phosphatidylglycerol:prolipoprotein diacylglycerol transferase